MLKLSKGVKMDKDYEGENSSLKTFEVNGVEFKVNWFNYSDESIPKYRLFQKSSLEKHNEYSEGGNHYLVGNFFDDIEIIRYVDGYKSKPENEKPRGNDLVIVEHDDWYARKKGEFMRIESVFGSEAHCCCGINPSAHKRGESKTCSISGGPFTSVKLSELKDTGKTKEVINWCWGIGGSGANMGVKYSEEVKIWKWEKLK